MSRFSNQADTLPTGEVVFASFQSLNYGAHKFSPDHFDYIVYDEAHHIEAKTYKKVVEYFTPKFQLGLTATPERGDGKDITGHFGEALYTKTLPEGIAEEYLADVHYRLMLDEESKQLLQSGFKPKNLTELNKIFNFDPKPEDVAEAIGAAQQELRDKTGLAKVKTIIFSSDIAAADEMAHLMGGEGYHSDIGSEKEKKAVLEAFRNGELETIVTRDMFNEGVDIPDARLIVFFRSTQSRTVFEQQLGRGLRKTEGKDEVTVLDFVANAERIRLVRELADGVRKGKGSTGKGGGTGGGTAGGLSISAGKSDFEFDQQIIDILDLYDYIRAEEDIEQAPENVVSLDKFAAIVGIHSATLKSRIRSLGVEPDDLPRYRFKSGHVGRGIDTSLQNALLSAEVSTDGLTPFYELIRHVGIHKRIATQNLLEHLPDLPKMKFGHVWSYALTAEQVTTFLAIPYIAEIMSSEELPEGAKILTDFMEATGLSRYLLKQLLSKHGIVPSRFRVGGRIMEGLTKEQQATLVKYLDLDR